MRPWHRERGHSGWSPSSGLGLALGAEPSLALRRRDYRSVVPATTQHVVDAVAPGTDVAFDPTARQIVVSSGLRRQSLATPPVPRRHELTGPQPPPRSLRGRLLAGEKSADQGLNEVRSALLALGIHCRVYRLEILSGKVVPDNLRQQKSLYGATTLGVEATCVRILLFPPY